MSIQILYQADVLIDGIAGSTEFCRIKFSVNQPVKDRTAFQDSARANLPGIYVASADGEFYYQTGSAFVANKLEGVTVGPSAGVFSPQILTLAADLTVGNIVNIWKGVSAKLEEGAAHGEILKGQISTEAADRTVQATRLIRAAGGVTGTSGLGTALNLGALAANQALYAAMHVVATTGGASGTVFSIISSATSSLTAPTTRITFGTGTSQVAGDWQSVAGAVTDTWWAFKWASYTGTGCTVSASAGIQ